MPLPPAPMPLNDADYEAIEAAAVGFKTDAWKLIAVRGYEIA